MNITISCPSCSFSRQVPAEKIPDGERRVTCPQCKKVFSYTKPILPAGGGVVPPISPTAKPDAPPRPDPVTPPQTAKTEPLSPPKSVPPPPPPRQRPVQPPVLTDIGDLFKESWAIFQRRFTTLIGLYLLTMVAFIVPIAAVAGLAILAGMANSKVMLVLAGAAGLIAALYLGFRCFGAFLHAVVDEQLGFAEALEKGNSIILPLLWVGLLTGFIIGGGFMLFVIPGIIFMVWFFFAQFILVKEDVRGMSAILKSREYVRGEWFNVALRLLLIWVATILVGIIPLLGPLLNIVFFPFVMIYHYLIYCDLKNLKGGDVLFSCGAADLFKWPGAALAGYVIVPAVLISVAGFSLFGKLSQFKPVGGGTFSMQPSAQPDTQGVVTDSSGLRVITFPQKEGTGASTDPAGAAATIPTESSPSAQTGSQSLFSSREEYPKDIHIFIYAVNYTGTIMANGTTIKEMEGKPDMQYNYNMDGKGLRYGQNQIDIDYAELPNPPSTMLEVHLKVSRSSPGKGKEILGDWRFSEKGSGRKTFTFDIPGS